MVFSDLDYPWKSAIKKISKSNNGGPEVFQDIQEVDLMEVLLYFKKYPVTNGLSILTCPCPE